MLIRSLLIGIGLAGGLVYSQPATAATDGWATRAVNMRVCPSVRCARILTIPARARVRVYGCERWCEVRFAGRDGFVSARYITLGGYRRVPPPIYRVPPPFYRHDPLPPYYRWRPRPPRYRPPPAPPGSVPHPPGGFVPGPPTPLPPPGYIPGPPPPPPQPGPFPPIYGR